MVAASALAEFAISVSSFYYPQRGSEGIAFLMALVLTLTFILAAHFAGGAIRKLARTEKQGVVIELAITIGLIAGLAFASGRLRARERESVSFATYAIADMGVVPCSPSPLYFAISPNTAAVFLDLRSSKGTRQGAKPNWRLPPERLRSRARCTSARSVP